MKSRDAGLDGSSRFYLASAYIADGDLPNARDSLVAFLAEERDPLFRSLALTNLAVVYERMADWKKAAGAYQQAAADPGPEQVRAELGVARMLAKSGDKQGAIAAYRGFLNAHPFAQQRQDVMESLALLGAPADVVADPSGAGRRPAARRHSLVDEADGDFFASSESKIT